MPLCHPFPHFIHSYAVSPTDTPLYHLLSLATPMQFLCVSAEGTSTQSPPAGLTVVISGGQRMLGDLNVARESFQEAILFCPWSPRR